MTLEPSPVSPLQSLRVPSFGPESLVAHGFVLEKSYDGLRNPKDPLDKMVYDAAVKGKTDRYVHLYRVK